MLPDPSCISPSPCDKALAAIPAALTLQSPEWHPHVLTQYATKHSSQYISASNSSSAAHYSASCMLKGAGQTHTGGQAELHQQLSSKTLKCIPPGLDHSHVLAQKDQGRGTGGRARFGSSSAFLMCLLSVPEAQWLP